MCHPLTNPHQPAGAPASPPQHRQTHHPQTTTRVTTTATPEMSPTPSHQHLSTSTCVTTTTRPRVCHPLTNTHQQLNTSPATYHDNDADTSSMTMMPCKAGPPPLHHQHPMAATNDTDMSPTTRTHHPPPRHIIHRKTFT